MFWEFRHKSGTLACNEKGSINENPGLDTEFDEIIQMAASPIGDTGIASFNRFVTK